MDYFSLPSIGRLTIISGGIRILPRIDRRFDAVQLGFYLRLWRSGREDAMALMISAPAAAKRPFDGHLYESEEKAMISCFIKLPSETRASNTCPKRRFYELHHILQGKVMVRAVA
ncbi:hypothetical protein OOJ96_15555 [Pseudomonas sp. 15FMM2]|uniref:Uncharacterized protein n=1 Tax=Pseudomonas imrae TaxID=2992837 RepID=A0ACC7PHR1_9PSED